MKYTYKQMEDKIESFISKNKDLYLSDFISNLEYWELHNCNQKPIGCWNLQTNGRVSVKNGKEFYSYYGIFKLTEDGRLVSLLDSKYDFGKLFLSILVCDEEDKI